MDKKVYVARRVTSQDGLSLYLRDYPGPKHSKRTPLLCLGGLIRNSKDFAGLAEKQAMEALNEFLEQY